MKALTIALLTLIGLYWLFAHTSPFPFNHEQLGLYYHGAHRITGILFLIGAIYVAFRGKIKNFLPSGSRRRS